MPENTTTELSYFDKRMAELGVTPEINTMKVLRYDAETRQNILQDVQVFKESDQGIDIFVCTLDRCLIPYAKEGARWKHQNYCITRLKEPMVKKGGEVMKYRIPKGAGTFPFFPPQVIDAFEAKEDVHTLVLTEGFFKAFKGAMCGMHVIGLSSITHFRDADTKKIYPDIIKFILKKNVKRVIWLQDGDCLNITSKDVEDGMDLYKRPAGFFASAQAFKQLLDDYDVEKYFAHILSDELEGHPKGLDDLLNAFPKRQQEIVDDLVSVSGPGKFFWRENITYSTRKLRTHFNLDNVDTFYLYHLEKRPEIKGKAFKFNGTTYRWDEEKNVCKVESPAEAKNYFRVGDQYYEFVNTPNKYGDLERYFHRRLKETIRDDYGKEFCTHIAKYKAFCNVPDHVNYQRVIHNCFNIYAPFEHEPEEGDCPTILKFIKHMFGSGQINFQHPKTKEKMKINEYDLGLDYLQLLYTRPTQILPILCFVSRENGTGKSTFAKLLKAMFTQNVAIVGNAELADNFNASWASKLLIICDEAKIDKQIVVEKVKSLSTADKVLMNAKGKDHVELDFFGKFMFLTNNEDNFIYASDDDVRYWIRKVPVITELNVDMLKDMIEEVPSFLHMLNTRKLVTDCLHRAWFDPSLIKTDALKKVIQYSMPTIEKEIRSKLRDMFLDFNCDEIMMTKKVIHKDFFNMRYEDNYLEHILNERIKAELFHEIIKNEEGEEVKKYKVIRYTYPRWERRMGENGIEEIVRVEVKDLGRPYVFKRKDFITGEQLTFEYEPAISYVNTFMNNAQMPGEKDDLPY